MTTMPSAPPPATWRQLIAPLSLNLGTTSAKTFPGFPLKKDKFPESDTAPLNTRLLYLASTGTSTPTTAPVTVVSLPSLLTVTDTAAVYGSSIASTWLHDTLYKKEMGEDCKLISKSASQNNYHSQLNVNHNSCKVSVSVAKTNRIQCDQEKGGRGHSPISSGQTAIYVWDSVMFLPPLPSS